MVMVVADGRPGTFLRGTRCDRWCDMSVLCPSTEQCSASLDQCPESSAVGFARYGCKISLKYQIQQSCSNLNLLITCRFLSVETKLTGGGGGAVVNTVASLQEGCDFLQGSVWDLAGYSCFLPQSTKHECQENWEY